MSREQLAIEFGGAGGNENPEALMEADSWINQCWSYEDDTRPDGITKKWHKWHVWRKKWLFLYEKDVEEDKDGETRTLSTKLKNAENIFETKANECKAVKNYAAFLKNSLPSNHRHGAGYR
jgi:hypothetical protein